jgi:hypothetical protein
VTRTCCSLRRCLAARKVRTAQLSCLGKALSSSNYHASVASPTGAPEQVKETGHKIATIDQARRCEYLETLFQSYD